MVKFACLMCDLLCLYLRQWEEKYGAKARHLQDEKGLVSVIKCYNGFVIKVLLHAGLRGKKPLSQQKKSRRLEISDCTKRQGSQPSKTERQGLHPSWEASRRKKEQQHCQPFQGQRTVFTDSDD